MEFFVYILYSALLDKFYIGFTTSSIEDRINRHLSDYYDNKFTGKTKDWKLFYSIKCEKSCQARAIERHIKRMKSKKYIKNLVVYPEISKKLLKKYNDC
jgi:putative endonuclease